MNPTLSQRQRELDIIACRTMLAYMEPDRANRAVAVWTVEQESGLTPQATAAAGITAWQSSLFWRATDPELGRTLLEQRLDQLSTDS